MPSQTQLPHTKDGQQSSLIFCRYRLKTKHKHQLELSCTGIVTFQHNTEHVLLKENYQKSNGCDVTEKSVNGRLIHGIHRVYFWRRFSLLSAPMQCLIRWQILQETYSHDDFHFLSVHISTMLVRNTMRVRRELFIHFSTKKNDRFTDYRLLVEPFTI